jgi:8-oxo-dGTP pyrophosphatase MutT (NUDIX family)
MAGAQQIPRPPGARPGGPPPWAGVEARLDLGRVRAAMASRGPSIPVPELPWEASPAAVLVPLFEEDGQARVILTRRSSNLRSHTGQVSFPGGRLDEGEAPLAAALREAGEEIGIDPAAVEIVGELSPLSTLSQRSGITPFVGVLPSRPELRPNPAEVELAFDAGLDELVAVYRSEVWVMPERGEWPMHFFELAHDTVWGATARILHELLELVLLAPAEG